MAVQTFFVIFGISAIVFASGVSSDAVKIGFLSDSWEDTKLAFRYGIKYVNERHFRRLIGDVKEIEYGDVFSAFQSTCEMLENGVMGIVGPTSAYSSVHVQSICDTKEIPLIEMKLGASDKSAINLHPSPEDLGRVYVDLIEAWGWKSFTILYEDAPWLPSIEYLIRNCSSRMAVAVRQLDLTLNFNYRQRLQQVKKSEEKNIILSCSIERLEDILMQAQQVGLLTDEHTILITSLDMHTLDLTPFQYSGTNITGLRMVFPEDDFVKKTADFFEDKYFELPRDGEEDPNDHDINDDTEIPLGLTPDRLRVETALAFDSVLLFAHVVTHNPDVRSDGIDCRNPVSTFTNGETINNYMRANVSFKGLTGDVSFNPATGHRNKFHLEIVELASEGLRKVGTWNSSVGLTTYHDRSMIEQEEDPFKAKVLKILTVDNNPPYGIRKKTSERLTGNNQYEGFVIELIEYLSLIIGFNYTFELQEDRKYGKMQADGSWDGMIGQLMDDKADLAITDLTMTSERVEAADFTMPFMDLGIQILFQSPTPAAPRLLSFMEPFSGDVWTCVACSILVVSISFFILGRMSPKEWDNPFPCIEEPTVLQNQFTFKNAMWFTIGAILQEGSDIAPKAPSTRIVASIWWFFTLIMVSSYTANLASFLTVQKDFELFTSVDGLIELADQGKAMFGAKIDGSTDKFFQESKNPTYIRMFNYMKANHEKVMVRENDDGVARAKLRTENYAFLMESSTIQYLTQRQCDLIAVGKTLDEKSYGIAMKKGSPLRTRLDEAILQMQESGQLTKLRNRWWNEKHGGGACDAKAQGDAPRLTFAHVKGIFFVMLSGCLVGTIIGIFRWFMNMKRLAVFMEVPFKEVFKEEWKFTFQFSKLVKPRYPTRKDSTEYDSANNSPRESNISGSGSRSNSTVEEQQPHTLRLSTRNIHKIGRENI